MMADIGPAFLEDIPVKRSGVPLGDVKVKSRFRADMDFGYRLTPYFSSEFELGCVIAKLEDVGQHDFIQFPIMVNLKLAWPNSSRFKPYAGIGLGGIETYAETTAGPKQSDSEFGFGYQIIGGIEYGLNKHLALGFGYRYLVGSDLHPGNGLFLLKSPRTHSFALSLSYAF
ncbi:MAG: porin family protein [Verrucomicrobia bacterium]|nr:porin family protein [Verrucomicrobiota bacterium]